MHNTNEQLEILDRIARAKLLVIGDVMLDRYWSGKASRLSPEAPVPVVALDAVRNIPGGAANVAANIAGLGAAVYLAGVTGDDESGGALRSTLSQQGISHELLIKSSSRPTTTKTRVLVHNQQIARIDDETKTTLSRDEEDRLIEGLRPVLDTVDAVVVSDYAKGCLTENVLSVVIAKARENEKPVIVDPKSRDLSKYDGASLLTPNLSEALAAAGLDTQSEEAAGEAASAIFSQAKVDALLITLGEHGMILFQRGQKADHFPSMARQVFDVTGAGDTVAATLSASLAAGADLRSAIALANLAAGLAVEKVGTTIVPLEELRNAIHEQALHMSMET